MSSFRVRPFFRQNLPLEKSAARERFANSLTSNGEAFELKNFPDYLCLRIPQERSHFWSPQLSLSFDDGEGGGTVISGIYGPNSNVWSLFIYGYGVSGLTGLFSGIFGFTQLSVGHYAWGLWIFGVAMLGALALYLAAQYGQKLGAQQMFQLHQAYEAAAGGLVEIH